MSSFSQAAWVVWESFSQEEFLAAISVNTTSRRGWEGTTQRTSSLIHLPPSVVSSHARIVAAREHEWAHYRQAASTQWGLVSEKLAAIEESTYVRHLAQVPNGGPVDLSTQRLDELASFPWAFISVAARAVRRTMWKATIDAATLDMCLRVIESFYAEHTVSAAQNTTSLWPVGLRPDAQCVPGEFLTVENLVEGFARCRELWELKVHFREDAGRHFASSDHRIADYALAYLRARTGLAPEEPTSIALLDMAVATFQDPELSGRTLPWETIHPGRALALALDSRSDWPRLQGLPARDAYELVAAAFGTTLEDFAASQFTGSETLRDAAFTLENRGDFNATYHATIWGRMADLMALRADCPWVFGLTQHVLDTSIWNRYVNASSPHLICDASGIRSMHLDTKPGVVAAMTALNTLVYEDLRFGGSLARARKFLRAVERTGGEALRDVYLQHVVGALPPIVRDDVERRLVPR